ncbi:type II toxin-antitoxin system HicB family antitoxin [Pelagicoccus sp. SDUM812002]|uniref:type II toxin-antitoxin system HicB family antitoxin n=1 Tax=Pelagicoccus sp. SDUM812002 TaxID=3041266 RepID=UPI00280CE962|nr:type II toxin-antitoxin system HicB family antitoxin [Pelagicoccus sp. SDUM812002]MDQ8188524.1 type II toxin-antitoxin system HicB family antitoxin [Pelagicoccus sp. SDUM812002]
MEYKGYIGTVQFDDEAEIFHGEVINMRDVVTFQGDTVEGLKKEFQLSIDDYLEFCGERGEEPDKPFSGKLTLRLDPDLHRSLYIRSKKDNKSLNNWIVDALKKNTKSQQDA